MRFANLLMAFILFFVAYALYNFWAVEEVRNLALYTLGALGLLFLIKSISKDEKNF